MTFAQLKEKLFGDGTTRGSAFPLGTPENILPLLDDLLVEAMIEIQRSIDCWQHAHTDVYPACATHTQNGTSVITKPDGEIRRVYTIENGVDGWLYPIPYNPVELPFLRRWMSRLRSRSGWILRPNKPVTGHEGFSDPSATQDSLAGRALSGIYALDNSAKRLIVAPWIQSTEALVVEWDGIKRQWLPGDSVSDNPDFIRLVRLWIVQEYGRIWSAADLQVRVDTWRSSLADQLVTCERSKHLAGPARGEEEADEIAAYYGHNPQAVVVPDNSDVATTKICFVGDSGLGSLSEAASAVGAAIVAEQPDAAFIAGDVHYPTSTIEESLAPFDPLLGENRLYAALGNHDLDGDAGVAVLAALKNPGNGRYFNALIGSVEVFVVSSGINTAGDVVEPDGNTAGSAQWMTVRSLIARSCARWKVVVLHHAPRTSGARYTPGREELRWVSDLEVHAVVCGHSHNYERATYRGRQHFVVGTGGGMTGVELDGFGEPLDGSETRLSSYGYLRLTATSDSCLIEFVEVDGTVADSIELTGDPPLPEQ